MGSSRYESLEANEIALVDINSSTHMSCKTIAQFTTHNMHGPILKLELIVSLVLLVFIIANKPFVLTSYEFQNYKISYADEVEHPLFHENEYFCNVFVLRENPQFYQNTLLYCPA